MIFLDKNYKYHKLLHKYCLNLNDTYYRTYIVLVIDLEV
jgi:hypothetical protein